MTNDEYFQNIKQRAEAAYNKKAALGPILI